MVEGRRRLALLEHALDPSTFRRLETIGVAPGWRCLDLGAGGGTVCGWLSPRVGPNGRVVALDLDARFLRMLPCENVEIREENVVDAELPAGAFDLVHTRWTLLHIPQREQVLEKLAAALRPGGTLFLEEPDLLPVEALERTGWHDVTMRVLEVVRQRGTHAHWGRELPDRVAALGLTNVRAEAEFPWFHGGSELAEFWKISWGLVRDAVAAKGGDASPWDRELAELDDPARRFAAPMTVSVIATRP